MRSDRDLGNSNTVRPRSQETSGARA